MESFAFQSPTAATVARFWAVEHGLGCSNDVSFIETVISFYGNLSRWQLFFFYTVPVLSQVLSKWWLLISVTIIMYILSS